MNLLKFLPNFFTLTNLFVGCVAVVFGIIGDFETLAILVSVGLVCDFFDGFFARLLKIDSSLGIQLDSLSDLVTFGLTSSVVIMNFIGNSTYVTENSSNIIISNLPYFAFLIAIASSYRLAKFNIAKYSNEFKGLPTPANAVFIVFLPFFIERFNLSDLFENIYFLFLIVCFSSYMLISNHKMISLKLTNFNFKENKLLLILIICSIILLAFFGLASMPIIILLYIFLNLLRFIF